MRTDYEMCSRLLHSVLLRYGSTHGNEFNTSIRDITMMVNGFADYSMEYVSVLLEVLNYEGKILLRRKGQGRLRITVSAEH